MDGEMLQFLLEIAPSLATYIPKITEKIKGKKDDELYETLTLAMQAMAVDQTAQILTRIGSVEGKLDTCDENIGRLLKRTARNRASRDEE
jgi:hypothetical protein